MRIWDINPGYLNRQSLLGEHRELHGIVSIITNGKKGYSKHPETLRWVNYGWAIKIRHKLLAAEMELRGYTDRSPVNTMSNEYNWPEIYIDKPFHQFEILKKKYIDKEPGRIPLPKNAQQLWAQHKYSVMARDYNLYKQIASDMSTISNEQDFSSFIDKLVNILRIEPDDKARRNTLQHMWGYVSKYNDLTGKDLLNMSQKCLLKKIQDLSKDNNQEYLLHSTALSELIAWF